MMMTAKQFSVFTIAVVLAILLSVGVHGAIAQNYGGVVMLNAQTSLSGCTWPTAYATIINGLAICPLNLTTGPQIAIAVNGGTFVPVPMSQGNAPVTSVFGRTGAVVPASGDYSYSQLSSPPTTISCPTATLSSGTTGAFSASGCVIK